MDIINDIIRLIGTKKIAKSDIIGLNRYNSSAERLFFDIKSGLSIQSDEDLSNYLYGESGKIKSARKFKNRFKAKLINTFIVVGGKNKKDIDIINIYHKTSKYWVTGILLEAKGAKKASTELFKQVLKNSMTYEFTDLGYLASSKLAVIYGVTEENVFKQAKYGDMQQQYLTLMSAENKVEQIYSKLKALQGKDKSSQKREVYLFAKESSIYIKSIMKKFDSFKFKRFAFLSIIIYLQLKREYEKIISTCNEAITYFQSKSFNSKNTVFSFELKKLLVYIQTKNYKLGNLLKSKYEIVYSQEEYNWFVIKYYFFILSVHTKNYNQAFLNIVEVFQNKRVKQLPISVQENFQVFETYIHFLIKQEKVKLNNPKEIKQFRLGRFLNEVPHFSKDKRGLNISILILQVLFLLHDKKYSNIIDRTDALNQYCYRYLRKDETFRSNCFIKMLIQMVKADFNRIRTERYVEPIWKKLQEVPIHVAEQGIEVEIIPYEDLWPMVLEMLDS